MKICEVDGCERKHYARTYCQMHYSRWKANGDVGEAERRHSIKGDGHMHSGYKVLAMPNHPNATKRGKLMEHIFVMSEALRRPLRKGETVHHINGIKTDNRLENLELWTGNHPTGQRVSDLQEFASKIAFSHGLIGELAY